MVIRRLFGHQIIIRQFRLKLKRKRELRYFENTHTVRQRWHDRSQFRSPPMPACKYVEENGLAAMLAAKRLAGVAPEVSLNTYASAEYK